ncbi:hypothetical protein CAPTEDRAFT_211137 [Capitella teleta]|uniref:VWFD domain-containing protein n=1 Tax=Capitella teleta TaxID=283909 RepID=R7TKZ8_CAPTE|nr:hypothetical protein CAPTEDRAFT_211137 [Capitella teleta]|eukprot:ELT94513.1 hypothetical protein CAPTEDRAFT_211137 [Capitella teleta]
MPGCKRKEIMHSEYRAPPSVCSCWGDPHCEGFSISEILVRGSCRYVLASDDCDKNDASTFKISGSFHTVKPTSTRSYIRTVHVDFKLASGTGVQSKPCSVD